jgi:dihydrolipoamide dehydrogenase
MRGRAPCAAGEADVVVVGGGPAGVAAALRAAAGGLSVVMAEAARVGGTCLHQGCIPAKELLETAAVFRAVARASEFGILAGPPSVDLGAAQERNRAVIDRLRGGLAHSLRTSGVEVVEGRARLAPERVVEVDGHGSLRARRGVILATGSSPRALPGFPFDGERVLSSDNVVALERVPASAVVVGGGAVGCEFASLLADFGARVTLLEAAPSILPGCDPEVARIVVRAFRRRGIDVRLGAGPSGLATGPGGVTIRLDGDGAVEAEVIVVAVGRAPRTGGLGLERTGVVVDQRGCVEVDARCRTAEPGVWAVGDLIGTPQLAHVGHAEGVLAATDLLGEDSAPIDYGLVPCCIYSHPEVAFVGLDEETARRRHGDVVVSRRRFVANGRASIVGETEGLVKVIATSVAGGRDSRLLGVHMAGPWVTEQLGQGTLALHTGWSPAELARVMQPHPAFAEVFGEALHEVAASVRAGTAETAADRPRTTTVAS